LGAANQANWERLIEALAAPELASDPRFADGEGRLTNLPALVEALNPHFLGRSSADWLALLEAAGVPAGPVLSVGEMHQDPQAQARDMVPEVDHPVAGAVKTLGLPVKFSETPGAVVRPAPLYGQHNREILAEIGYDPAEIDILLASGALSGD
jgi:crotonobetainyl-CoA:carnitine CoA-transferase CaiB-like acyl-CoA transferase